MVRTLLADAQALDQFGIPVGVLAFQVIEQAPALADELQQAAARMMILGVGLEVFGQVADALAEQGDLNFRGAGVAVVGLVSADDPVFRSFVSATFPPRTAQMLSARRAATRPPYC